MTKFMFVCIASVFWISCRHYVDNTVYKNIELCSTVGYTVNIDLEKNARYVIERVLDFGTDAEARWVYQRYPHPLIREVIDNPRRLHAKTRDLWNELIPR